MYYESEVMRPWPEWASSDGARQHGVGTSDGSGYRVNLPLAQMEWLGCGDPTQNSSFDVRVVSMPVGGTIDGRILLAPRPCRVPFVGVQ